MFIFRGVRNESHTLETSWNRWASKTLLGERFQLSIAEVLRSFWVGSKRIGLHPFNLKDRIESMEIARHYGVPMPCLDFSYSPYIALFFAFENIKFPAPKDEYSVVYAIDIEALEQAHAQYRRNQSLQKGIRHYQQPFSQDFPLEELIFIPFPGEKNTRMQKQFGCFLYDTLSYGGNGVSNLEEYILRNLGNVWEHSDVITHKSVNYGTNADDRCPTGHEERRTNSIACGAGGNAPDGP